MNVICRTKLLTFMKVTFKSYFNSDVDTGISFMKIILIVFESLKQE